MENIVELTKKLKNIECGESSTLVFDLFGNSSFRFEQFDGSFSMPFKHAGRFHLAGKIVACPLSAYKRILENTAAILTLYQQAKVVIVPPLPRYLFVGCCKQSGHSTNVSDPNHSSTLLSETIGLRNHLKKFTASLGIKRCLVLDSCCIANCPSTANTPTCLEALKKVCAPDGVHFTADGYQNMAGAILGGDSQLSVSNRSVKVGKHSHYWRGFKSTRGSASVSMRGGKSARGGRFMRQFHPYRRGK
jgi:hypothetical protein